MPIVDYIILDDEDKERLEEKVREKMKEGYIPTGGFQVVVLPGARYLTFFKDMYKFTMGDKDETVDRRTTEVA